MGQPGDVDRFRDVLELVKGSAVRRLRVGSIEVEFAPHPSEAAPKPYDPDPGEAHLTPDEERAELEAARAEYESRMYGASEGLDQH